MSIDRDAMLERLKSLPAERLAELIFKFRLDADIPEHVAPSAQAMKLIQHVKAKGEAAWRQLESLVASESGGTDSESDPDTPRIDISRIDKYAPQELLGRETETALLEDSWEQVVANAAGRPHILTFVALGGEGKTSLVAKWAAGLAARDWPGCDAAFAWSFYSQGTRDQVAASSDLFLKEALTFFGNEQDRAFAASSAGAFEKGQRLARIVGRRRNLLILDGLEPLQYPPASPTPGELKDQSIAALLQSLAASSRGLCVITTRYPLPGPRAFHGNTVREEELTRLSRDAGVKVLKAHGVTGSDRRNVPLKPGDEQSGQVSEFEKLVEDVDGHALTLHIMGSFLKRAHRGDIRRRDVVTFAKASRKTDNDHAMRAMAAYDRWLEDDSDEARRELALLRLMGLFDRPADAGCIAALLQEPAIPGLTEALVGISEEDWNTSLDSLASAKLITVSPDVSTIPDFRFPIPSWLDAHPLLREHSAVHLKTNAKEAWQAGHRRLYEYLCQHEKGDAPTLEDLQPLYQAVAHGCQAGLTEEARANVYRDRILRGAEHYTWHKLGAYGSELGAQACFFKQPWREHLPGISEGGQAWLFNETAFCLRALGRLTEALEPMRAGLENYVKQKNWHYAAILANNLSELEQMLGEVSQAERDAAQSVTYADRSGDAFQRESKRTTHADALHQAGRRAEAVARFREAEQMQAERQPAYPLLYSLSGFRYCDLLLAEAERACWNAEFGVRNAELMDACGDVSQRAAQTLKWVTTQNWLLDIALDHLTLGRASFYAAILSGSEISNSASGIEEAVKGLRRAGRQDYLPRALLTRAWQRFLSGSAGSPPAALTGPDSAQSDLDEAWEIAERGAMRLFLADIHLTRCRLFGIQRSEDGGQTSAFSAEDYPWESPQRDLEEAERLINECGYHRRDGELADAKTVIDSRS